MATLTGQYISQSYGGIIQLSTNTGITTGSNTQLQDGLGTNLGVFLNGQGDISATDISLTGSVYTQPIGPFGSGIPSIVPFSVLEGPVSVYGKQGNLIMTSNVLATRTGSVVLSGSNNIYMLQTGTPNSFVDAGFGAGVVGTNSIMQSPWYVTGSNGSGYNRPAWPIIAGSIMTTGWTLIDRRPSTVSTSILMSSVLSNASATTTITSGSMAFSNSLLSGPIHNFTDIGSTNTSGLTFNGAVIGGYQHTVTSSANLSFGFGGEGTTILGITNTLLLSGSFRRGDGISIIGAGLNVTGSEANFDQRGATYVGRYNATDSTSQAGNTALAVGTGTSGSRRTSLHVSSSGLTTISDGLRLTPQNPLPAGSVGTLAVSGSNLFYHNGTSWSQIN